MKNRSISGLFFFILSTIGLLLLGCLMVRGNFTQATTWPHLLAWGLIFLGLIHWMSTTSPTKVDDKENPRSILLFYAFLGTFFFFPILMSDGDFYYAALRSMLWDRDTNTYNEGVRYAHGWLKEQAILGDPYGFPYHPFPLGASLLWFPFVLLGHIETWLRSFWDSSLRLDGYAYPYIQWIALGTAFYGAMGLIFCYRFLRLWFSHSTCLKSLVAVLLGTPLFYYCFRDSGFPHAQAMASLALFCWLWARDPTRQDPIQLALLAVSLAAVAMIRWQNGLFALAPFLYWLLAPACSQFTLLQRLRNIAYLSVLVIVFCLPQIAFFLTRGPDPLALQHGSKDWNWLNPHFYSLLFDREYGIIVWHPLYLWIILGWFLFLGKSVTFQSIPDTLPTGARPTTPSWKKMGLFFAGTLLWLMLANVSQHHPLMTPFALITLLVPPLLLAFRAHLPSISALGWLLFCAGLLLYVDASYLLWHGGGDYGNRLLVDLTLFTALGFAGLLDFLSRYEWKITIAILWGGCTAWSLALLWKASPHWWYTPPRVTETLSHGTPFASLFQGLGHLDFPLFLHGLYLGILLFFLCLAGHQGIVRLQHCRQDGSLNLIRWIRGLALLAISLSLWMLADLRMVTPTLLLYNPQLPEAGKPGTLEMQRQAFSTELVPLYPPGLDRFFHPRQNRFQHLLTPAQPSVQWLVPVLWPTPDRSVAYEVERLILLSRVHGEREPELGETIARVELGLLGWKNTSWRLRAGIETDHVRSLRLPAAVPDWYTMDVQNLPRCFEAHLIADPTEVAHTLSISLEVRDATLEILGAWLALPHKNPTLFFHDIPGNRLITRLEKDLFSRDVVQIPIPVRLHPHSTHPAELFPPHSREPWSDNRFHLLGDPTRLLDGKSVDLLIPDSLHQRPPGWHVLDETNPSLMLPLKQQHAQWVMVALVLGPHPFTWNGQVVALLSVTDNQGRTLQQSIVPGKNISFWGEPWFPERNLLWKEDRSFRPSVGVWGFSLDTSQLAPLEQLNVDLTSEGVNNKACMAVVGASLDKNE